MGDEELCPAGGKENLRNHSLCELPRKSTENGAGNTMLKPTRHDYLACKILW
jgi:hypothetical protein